MKDLAPFRMTIPTTLMVLFNQQLFDPRFCGILISKVQSKEKQPKSNSNVTMSVEVKNKPTNTKDKQYECEICGTVLKSSSPSHIERHMRIHNESKPFACEICDKRFQRKANLKTHQRIHTRN